MGPPDRLAPGVAARIEIAGASEVDGRARTFDHHRKRDQGPRRRIVGGDDFVRPWHAVALDVYPHRCARGGTIAAVGRVFEGGAANHRFGESRRRCRVIWTYSGSPACCDQRGAKDEQDHPTSACVRRGDSDHRAHRISEGTAIAFAGDRAKLVRLALIKDADAELLNESGSTRNSGTGQIQTRRKGELNV